MKPGISIPVRTAPILSRVRQVTHAPYGHILANRNVWSSDGHSIVYDIRDDETKFTGNRIERVFVASGEVETLYVSPGRSTCGVPTCCPIDERFVFIHSPLVPDYEGANEAWEYCAWHRHGVLGRLSQPLATRTLDARDIVPPFTRGALRGGTHLHMFSPDGAMVASTYEDHVLATSKTVSRHDNRRVIAITILGNEVTVPRASENNLDGFFTVVVTDVVDAPQAGSDEIYRAYSEAWIDNKRLAFHGDVLGRSGTPHVELFVVALADDLPFPGSEILQGTATTRCGVPRGVHMRRLSFTDEDVNPGMAGPRHWAVASPDGKWIGCFRLDASGHAQFYVVSPIDGEMRQVTSHPFSASSAFSWHPDSQSVAYVADGSVMQIDLNVGEPRRLTAKANIGEGPTHHACVFSPGGDQIAFMQPVRSTYGQSSQIFCVAAN